mmetsp:Transcript_25834/g.47166  ORF Transcript_25834/g.47166 Transcript_25834/m.47166 type:complete len:82 (+) Transcript_25834:403-648(+)
MEAGTVPADEAWKAAEDAVVSCTGFVIAIRFFVNVVPLRNGIASNDAIIVVVVVVDVDVDVDVAARGDKDEYDVKGEVEPT